MAVTNLIDADVFLRALRAHNTTDPSRSDSYEPLTLHLVEGVVKHLVIKQQAQAREQKVAEYTQVLDLAFPHGAALQYGHQQLAMLIVTEMEQEKTGS